ncbi:hypothetical protein JB92DRAFT_2836783 [Gautieria morchelliformis]|nr:hypothetical protein JB92DRAFT_2836783 [Gautieria morchelliformis]
MKTKPGPAPRAFGGLGQAGLGLFRAGLGLSPGLGPSPEDTLHAARAELHKHTHPHQLLGAGSCRRHAGYPTREETMSRYNGKRVEPRSAWPRARDQWGLDLTNHQFPEGTDSRPIARLTQRTEM